MLKNVLGTAIVDDLTLVQHQNPVCSQSGREIVANRNYSLVLQFRFEQIIKCSFGLLIQPDERLATLQSGLRERSQLTRL